MSEFRWLLLAAGVLIMAVIFWLTRRESGGAPPIRPDSLLRRKMPRISGHESGASAEMPVTRDLASGRPPGSAGSPSRVVTVRLTAPPGEGFGGEALVLALREAGLRHGRFGIFHHHDPTDDSRTTFSVASLVEPGTFNIAGIRTERFPGISLFLTLPGPFDGLAAFDAMLSTAHKLATVLNGELLDEHGSHLSIQRERFLREEVIQLQHRKVSV